ncbi:kinesin-like protein subito isoform X2 [Ceratina calcarata]|uniref:Kinesin-like protein subito isoform X2 n=1 Tax=Ceratina calcarata TaxID=156304 RepID=A0AAJ7S4P9_9HYME|nr:kinesin-like protein subito isoform X2 [Ceratina calcarata]
MDNTLDSIRPSTFEENPENEVSYLFGRDPSILAYGQRPCISKETKKNLLSVYEEEESEYSEGGSSSIQQETVKVYLRMKPFPKKLKLKQDELDAYTITDSNTLLTRLPSLDNNTSCIKKSNHSNIICRKFMFTQTFGPETTQLELFEQAVKPKVLDFLSGQNCTIMTYGTTNSGKSYTLQGTTTSPGIIPRCLEFVFTNVTPKSSPSYRPINHCDVSMLDPLERAQELEMKNKLLTFASVDKYQHISAYKEMQTLLQNESPIRPSECVDAHYSVWVSFAEIYNEIVYDLLSNECQKKRTPLKLATDNHGRTFIKGLKTVCVNSGSEAYQILMAGQYNLKVAATALNARSSRSHCIFSIKLLKYYGENDPGSVEVSTFTFCDLAGSERLKKTLNIGDRLKEAQNINSSLLVLGRCLKMIHEGQLSKQKLEHIGPFRESKLTRLFQRALSGKEPIVLIVNINPLPNLYVETQNVLNFSAIAKNIVIEKEKSRRKKRSTFSQIVTQSIKTITDWDATDLEEHQEKDITDYICSENYEELLNENERLRKEVASLKSSALMRDLEIRQEIADSYTAIMTSIETQFKERIKHVEEQQEDMFQLSIKQVEDFYKQKLDQVSFNRKRRCSSISEGANSTSEQLQEMEMENSQLKSRMTVLTGRLTELRETNQNLMVERNKVTFELSLTKEELKNVKALLNAAQQDICSDDDVTHYVEGLKTQLFEKQEQIKKLKTFLNEAKDDYIAITTDVSEKEYIIKKQKEELLEQEDNINSLEEEVDDLNEYLTEKSKIADQLEEKLETQTQQLIDQESKLHDMENKITILQNEKLLLLDEIKLLKETVNAPDVTDAHGADVPSEVNADTSIKEEQLSSCEVKINETSTEDKDTQTELEKEEDRVNEEMIALKEENETLKEKLVWSTTEVQSVKKELESTKVKLSDISEQVQAQLRNTDSAKVSLETKISEYEQKLEETEQQLSVIKNDHDQCTEKLKTVQAELDTQISKCLDEHVTESQRNLEKITELEEKINELNKQLEACEVEKKELQISLDDNNERLLDLEDHLDRAVKKEQEKDWEIKFLQNGESNCIIIYFACSICYLYVINRRNEEFDTKKRD